jgi:hypothetical protein
MMTKVIFASLPFTSVERLVSPSNYISFDQFEYDILARLGKSSYQMDRLTAAQNYVAFQGM